MTEQPPSAEATKLADFIRTSVGRPLSRYEAIKRIDALIAQRVSAALAEHDKAALEVVRAAKAHKDAAVSAETERIIEIFQAARAGEVDRDWRAIISMIECGRSAEQIKGEASS